MRGGVVSMVEREFYNFNCIFLEERPNQCLKEAEIANDKIVR